MGRVQPTGMGEEDEAAGAYSPRTADSPFRHANLEVPTMHLLGSGHPSPGSTRPSSRSRHRVGGFFSPRDDVRHWSLQTQTWSLPALFHVYGNSWTMKELYGIWCEMPLVLKSPKRGSGPTMKEHLGNRQKTHDEVVQFLDANNLGLMIMCSLVSLMGATGISITTCGVFVKKAFIARNFPNSR